MYGVNANAIYGLEKAKSIYDMGIMGVVSTAPGILLGSSDNEDKTNKRPVALNGRVPTKVVTENGEIKAGDYITSSSTPGVGMKATKPGRVVGIALEPYNGEGEGKIEVFINPGWHDPDVYITDAGDISIVKKTPLVDVGSIFPSNNVATSSGTLNTNDIGYAVKNSLGEAIIKVGVFKDAVIGNLRAGSIDVQNLTLGGNNLADLLGVSPALKVTTSSSQLAIATSSASLNGQPTIPPSILSRLDFLEARQARLDSLENLVFTLTPGSASSLQASSSSSAVLSASTSAVFDNLTITKKLITAGLGITGNISMGLLAINGLDTSANSGQVATINTLSGDLHLQNQLLGGINILNGKVVIDKNGNLKVQNTITAKKYQIDTADANSSSLGKAVLPADQTSMTINTTAVSSGSAVFVTPETVIDAPLAVSQKNPGQSFKVEVSKPIDKDVNFSWWIIN